MIDLLAEKYELSDIHRRVLKKSGMQLRLDILEMLDNNDSEGIENILRRIAESPADSAWDWGKEKADQVADKLGRAGEIAGQTIKGIGSAINSVKGIGSTFDKARNFDLTKNIGDFATKPGKVKKDAKKKSPADRAKARNEFSREYGPKSVKDVLDAAKKNQCGPEVEEYMRDNGVDINSDKSLDDVSELHKELGGTLKDNLADLFADACDAKKDQNKTESLAPAMQDYVNDIIRLGKTAKELEETTCAGSIAGVNNGFGSWADNAKVLRRIDRAMSRHKTSDKIDYGVPGQ